MQNDNNFDIEAFGDFHDELDDSFSEMEGSDLITIFIELFNFKKLNPSQLEEIKQRIKQYFKKAQVGINFQFQNNELFIASLVKIIIPRIIFALDNVLTDWIEIERFLFNNCAFLKHLSNSSANDNDDLYWAQYFNASQGFMNNVDSIESSYK